MGKTKERDGVFSTRRIHESMATVYGVTAYLAGTLLTRTEEEKIRDYIKACVTCTKEDFRSASNRGGYTMDEDELWNNYFLKQPQLRDVLARKGITSLRELKFRYDTEPEQRPRSRIKGKFKLAPIQDDRGLQENT